VRDNTGQLCICVSVEDPIIKTGNVIIPLTSLTLPHCCVCPKSGPGFTMSYVVVFSMFNELEMRGAYSSYWYWWNNISSLSEFSFHSALPCWSVAFGWVIQQIHWIWLHCFNNGWVVWSFVSYEDNILPLNKKKHSPYLLNR
jgi:hypothetical protein